MDTNRQDDRVFRYVRDILSTQRPDTGVPVVFGLARVNNATADFGNYLRYLLTDSDEPRTGELKRAVRELFEGTNNTSIGDGTVPMLEGATLSAAQVAELAYHVLSLDEKIPSNSSQNWRQYIRSWKECFINYNALHGDIWNGFSVTSFATNGTPVIIYRFFLLASGITRGSSFDPTLTEDSLLPPANSDDYEKFKHSVDTDDAFLTPDIRANIWRGFMDERNPYYLAGRVRKPNHMPLSSATMLEMFECYFNHREYTYDQEEYSNDGDIILNVTKTIVCRYWPMLGTIALGPFTSANTFYGIVALALLLTIWHYQRHSATSSLEPIAHWNPRRTIIYVVFCAFLGNSPLLAMATAVPIAVLAAQICQKWNEIKDAA